jgi:Tfp pilus assembly pilus retraction ATPase PilT
VRRIGGGRVAALELLIITSAIANLIRESRRRVGRPATSTFSAVPMGV